MEDSEEPISIPSYPEYSFLRARTLLKDAKTIEMAQFDKTALSHPRTAHAHKIEKSPEYHYQRNRKYKSESGNSFLYSRQKSSIREVLCPYCGRQKWVPLSKFKYHLLFGHGVVTIKPGGKFVRYLELPKRVIRETRGIYTNMYVECGECGKWVLLGKRWEGESDRFLEEFGLYLNYFEHASEHCL